MHEKVKLEKGYTNLVVGDERVEKTTRQGLLDAWLKVVPCSSEGNVGLIGRAATTGEHSDDTASSVEDNGTRVPPLREGTAPTVGQDGGLERGELDLVIGVVANERLESVDPAHRSARRHAVLDDRHRLVAMGIELLGLADLALWDDARDLEELVLRVLVASPV